MGKLIGILRLLCLAGGEQAGTDSDAYSASLDSANADAVFSLQSVLKPILMASQSDVMSIHGTSSSLSISRRHQIRFLDDYSS